MISVGSRLLKYVQGNSLKTTFAVTVLAAIVLYLLDVKFLLVPLLIGALALFVPYPAIFKSLFSRLVVASLLFYGLFQLSAIVQFFFARNTGFEFTAIFTGALVIGCILFSKIPYTSRPLFSRSDAWALLVPMIFVAPVLIFCYGPNGIYRTATIGGIQAIDGANHYSFMAQVGFTEELAYAKNNNYPVGYHLTTVFIQDGFAIPQSQLSWSNNVRLYIAQYLIMGAILGYVSFYLAGQIIPGLRKGTVSGRNGLLLAAALGLPLSVFYLLPFLYNGFLSYYYICATIIAGLTFLIAYSKNSASTPSSMSAKGVWLLAGFFLLLLGVSMNWPLLTPAFVIAAFLYLLPANIRTIKELRRALPNAKFAVISLGLLVQLVPVYFQLKYSVADTEQSLNATGSLYYVHFSVLLLGLGLAAYIVLSKTATSWIKTFISSIFLPLYLFLAALAAYQYFLVGEVRYYFIKSTFLLEIIILLVLVAVVVYGYTRMQRPDYKYLAFFAAIPFLIFMLAIAMNSNPLQDTRALFRNYSTQSKPAFFDEDVAEYVKLGQENRINDLNSTILHYDAEKEKFYAHMQIAYWSNVMGFGGNRAESEAWGCVFSLYTNLNFGTFSPDEQRELVETVKECASIAKQAGQEYYIITDRASENKVTELFGEIAVIKSY